MLSVEKLFKLKFLFIIVSLTIVSFTTSSCRHDSDGDSNPYQPPTFPTYEDPYAYSSAVFDPAQEVYKIASAATNDLLRYISAPSVTEVNCSISGSKSFTYNDTDTSGDINSGDTFGVNYNSCRDDDFNGIANGDLALALNTITISDISGLTGLLSDLGITVTNFTIREIDRDIAISNGDFAVSVNYDPSVSANFTVTSDAIAVQIGEGLETLSNIQIVQISNYTNGIIEIGLNGELQSENHNNNFSFGTVVNFSQYYLSTDPYDGYIDIKRDNSSTIRFSAPENTTYLSSMQYYTDANDDGVFETGPVGLSQWLSTDTNKLFELFNSINVSPSTTPPNTNKPSPLFFISSVSPSPNAVDVAFNAPVVVTFNNDIDTNSLYPYYVSVYTGTTTQSSIPNTNYDVTAQGNTLEINLNRVLEPSASFTITLSSSIRYILGNPLSYSDSLMSFSFTVIPYNNKIDIGSSLARLIYDNVNNVIYAIDKINKTLVTIDVATNTVSKTHTLTYRPDDICLDLSNSRMFIVNTGSSFITEFDLTLSTVTRNIPFSAPIDSNSSGDPRYRISCLPNKLILTDASFQPGLWSVDLSTPTPITTDLTTLVRGVGNFTIASDEASLYYWRQTSWSSPSWSGMNRIDLTSSSFSLLDSNSLGYESLPRNTGGYVPVFINPMTNQIINHRYVFNSLNLNQTYYTFPLGETILATDFSNNRVASHSTIYDLTTYNPVAFTPTKKANQMLFVNSGLLYMMVNDQSAMYYMDPSVTNTAN